MENWRQGKLHLLLLSLVVLLVASPFLMGPAGRIILEFVFSLILIAATWTLSGARRSYRCGLVLVVPSLLFSWAGSVTGQESLLTFGMAFRVSFLSYVAILLLVQVLQARQVTGNILSGAVSVYLLIGVIWAGLFVLLETAVPGSINLGSEERFPARHPYFGYAYLSYVTLTTLGYGDVTPVTSPARILALLEAVIGQLFLAVLIARLVGLHIGNAGAALGVEDENS